MVILKLKNTDFTNMNPYLDNNIDVNKTAVYDKVSFGKMDFNYFIG